MYWTSPDVLNIPQFTKHTLYKVNILLMNSLTYLKHYCDIFVATMVTIQNNSSISENKESSFVLKSCYYLEKYLSKSKQHGLPDALSNNLLFRSLSVMIYQQFMVSIAELIMLS